MSKYKYSNSEIDINKVLKYQSKELEDISNIFIEDVSKNIENSVELLNKINYDIKIKDRNLNKDKKVIHVRSWDSLLADADNKVDNDYDIESIFTQEELKNNEQAILDLKSDFDYLYKLDTLDITISVVAGIVGGAIDILMLGIPQKTATGIEAGSLSNYVRELFEKKFPSEEMEKLANSKISKVSYDAQDNRNTLEHVEGLSTYYHRLLSLGHDPLLGFIVGVFDILTGNMTTIDKFGKVTVQSISNYSNRREETVFLALAKQIIHLKSDITTSMGLPAPLMALFNLMQFGTIGEAEQNVAEIVQGMYYEGYDFINFCASSIPTMLTEVIVRLSYAFKRINEGHPIKESIPYSTNRDKCPKLATMLFMAHSSSTAINAGKVGFSKNPMAINYSQWITFTKYSYKQLKWTLLEKPEKRDTYINGEINKELDFIYTNIDAEWNIFAKENILVFD